MSCFRFKAAFCLLLIASGLALYTVIASHDQSVMACSLECGGVLSSKWSAVFGLNVGLLGLVTYSYLLISMAFRNVRWAYEFVSALVLGAALWFGVLQLVVLRAFCPWCCLTHTCAVAGVFLLWLNPRSRVTGPPSWGPVALASVVMVLFISLQTVSPERASTRLASLGQTRVFTDDASGQRILTLHDGEFTIDPDSLPVLGSAAAEHLIVALTDYTCSHCRKLHQSLRRVQDSLGGQLGIVSLPAFRGKASREIHRLMLALHREDPEKHAELSHKIFAEHIPAKIETILSEITTALPKGGLEQALTSHQRWIDEQFRLTKDVLAANKLKVETDNLPQLLIGSEVLIGSAIDDGQYYTLIRETLGLERLKAPRLEFVSKRLDLGDVFAGTGRMVSFEFSNVGNQTAVMRGMRIPPSWRVTSQPSQSVAPGETAMLTLMVSVPIEAGTWHKQFGLLSSAEPPESILTISGNVRRLINVDPPLLEFRASDSLVGAQSVRISLDEPVALQDPVPSPHVQLEVKVIDAHREYEIVVTPKHPLLANFRHGVIIPITPTEGASDLWPEAVQIPLTARDETSDLAAQINSLNSASNIPQ